MPIGAVGIASLVGAGISAAGQQQSAEYQAQVARNNQYVADQNADLALFRGRQEVGISRQRTAQMIGAQVAGAGASGVDVNSGSPLRAQQDTARLGEMDAQTIADNAARSAWGLRNQSNSYGAEAQADLALGRMGAMKSLIGGASNFAGKWSAYQQAGVGG